LILRMSSRKTILGMAYLLRHLAPDRLCLERSFVHSSSGKAKSESSEKVFFPTARSASDSPDRHGRVVNGWWRDSALIGTGPVQRSHTFAARKNLLDSAPFERGDSNRDLKIVIRRSA